MSKEKENQNKERIFTDKEKIVIGLIFFIYACWSGGYATYDKIHTSFFLFSI
jgi:hypothetical protein